MGIPAAVQTLQDVTNLVVMVGTMALVTLAYKISRYVTKREGTLDSIHAVVLNTRDNHLHHLQDSITDAHNEVLHELRDSNVHVIEAVRDSGDKIVQVLLTLRK